jgi:sulfide:quinone oxidoreductase
MTPFQIAPALSVAPQLSLSDVADAAAAGVRTLICNRPEGETPDQPATAAMRAAAKAHGMTFHHIPVRLAAITDADVDAFGAALTGDAGPALAYCGSGLRVATLWALWQAGSEGGAPTDALLAAAREAGFDLSPLRARLDARADGRADGRAAPGA